ncbi:MAG: SulP family inorganic anion transporter [Caldisericia bacterium]|nr:SulP family inorganic anion transporter [Caldisericia bacterium]MDD4614482.1 SulP family inorganic anion transporter [Caldisericia bacterium]
MKVNWFTEITAGITVGIVALPLALAFGAASGAGPAAGIYTAIVSGLIAGVFGGSRFQITGPTGAMTVVLISIVTQYGIPGMLVAGFMAGILQIIFGFLRVGKIIHLIPHSVVAGFTNGIAILIFIGQIKHLSGGILIAMVTILVILLCQHFLPKIPASFIGLLAGMGVFFILGTRGPSVDTIPQSLPLFQFPTFQRTMLLSLLKPAITIALLGSIESLLSAAVADNMTHTNHDPNRELIGQGLGNLAASFVGGVPSTGAIARTAVNIKSGGQTRWVSLVHSLLLLVFLLYLGSYTLWIPLAALAGVLAVTCWNMIDKESVLMIFKAPKSYTVVMIVTTIVTVLVDITYAVGVGILLAIVIHAFHSSKLHLDPIIHPDLPDNVQVYSMEGTLFFGNTSLLHPLKALPCHGLLVDANKLQWLDASAGIEIQKLAQLRSRCGKSFFLYGLSEELQSTLIRVNGSKFASNHLTTNMEQALHNMSKILPFSQV